MSLAVLALALPASASGSGTDSRAGVQPAKSALSSLSAVSADSATDAWAVGVQGFGLLIQHWDGSTWSSVKAPKATDGELVAVDAVTPTDAWAVGDSYGGSGMGKTLITHWDGSAWITVASPNPGGRLGNDLYGVSATSTTDAWAVGDVATDKRGTYATLIEHWDGTAWTQIPSPSPGGRQQSFLFAVQAVSPTDAWAVGEYGAHHGDVRKALIEHWDGSSWTVVPTGAWGVNTHLFGLSATSSDDVWAVGDNGYGAFAAHWDGSAWTPSTVTDGSRVTLASVSASSASEAWAVGDVYRHKAWRSATMHWDGTSWTPVASPNPGASHGTELAGVASISSDSALSVGDYYSSRSHDNALILRWDGSSWQQQP